MKKTTTIRGVEVTTTIAAAELTPYGRAEAPRFVFESIDMWAEVMATALLSPVARRLTPNAKAVALHLYARAELPNYVPSSALRSCPVDPVKATAVVARLTYAGFLTPVTGGWLLDQPAREQAGRFYGSKEAHRRATENALFGGERTAVYRAADADDYLLYVGITGSVGARQSAHAEKSSWAQLAVRGDIEWWPNRVLAEFIEARAIVQERPLFNHRHNDTPEARQRLVAYLVERGRLDLLTPAVSRG